MKPRRSVFVSAALSGAIVFTMIGSLASLASAATYQWDNNGSTAGLGGTGSWDAVSLNWDDLAAGSNLGADTTTAVAFTNADSAEFRGTAGTVTLAGPTTVNALRFDTAGYIVAGSVLTLDGASPSVTTLQNATVSSNLAGTAGMTKAGLGTLTLSGVNTLNGGISINQGTLKLGAATGIADNSNVTVSSGATFDYGGQGNVTTRNFSFTLSGTGVNSQGAMINTGGGIFGYASLGSVTLAANTSVGGTGRFDFGDGTVGKTFTGGGFTLTKVGSNQIVFRPETVTNLAAVNVNQGTWTYEGFSRTTAATSGMTNTIADGATLDSYGTLSFNMPLVFNGSSSLTNGNGTSTWTGAVTVNGALNVNSGNAINLQGVISGAGSLIKSNSNTLTLSNTSTYTGGTRIDAGTLALTHATDTLANTGAVTLNGGTLSLGANTDTVGAVTFNSGTLSGTGTLTGTSYTGAGTGDTTITGLLGGTVGLTHGGTGTLTINSAVAQPLTGGLSVSRGTVNLNFANIAASTDLLATTNALTLAGGTIQLTGKASTTNFQNFSGLTLNPGGGRVVLSANATANPLLLNVGAITRAANSRATLNITQPTGTISTSNGFVTSNANHATGILGAWATVGGADWAVTNGTSGVTAYASYTALPTSGGVNTTHYNMTADTTLAGATAAATLKIANTNLTLGGNLLTVNQGGILWTGNAGKTITGTTGGTRLTAGNADGAYDLVVHQYNTGGSRISAIIGNNGANAVSLVKAGTENLILTEANTYTGGTYINQGMLSVGNGGTTTTSTSALGTGLVTINPGAILRIWKDTSATESVYANNLSINGGIFQVEDGNSRFSGTVSLGSLGATFSPKYNGKNLTLGGIISGSGPVTTTSQNQTEAQVILTANATYTGGTTVSSGILTLQGSGGAGVGTIRGTVNVSAGGQLRLNAADVTGYGGGANALTTINLNGATNKTSTGTLHVNTGTGVNQTLGSATINMTGASITGVAGSNIDFFGGASALNTLASGTTSTISGTTLTLRQTGGATFTVADGSAATDLDVQSVITNGSYGAQALTKAGLGLMQLTGANNYSGATNINAGTLQVGGGSTTGNLGTGAVSVSSGATLTFNRSDAMTVSNAISGAGSIVKNAAGTLTLSGTNTHTGTVTVNTGRLNLAGSNTSSLTTLNSGAVIGGTGSTSGALTTSTGSFIALSGSAPTSALTAGTVTIAGGTKVVFDTAPAAGASQHTVLNYGTLAASSVLNLDTNGYRGSFTDDSANSRILLNLSTGTTTWNRSDAGNWDALGTGSWQEGDNLYANGDAVIFSDAATNGSVTLVGTLYPSSITVNNSTTDYTFSGSGTISGTTGITKSGTGTLTLNSGNTFTGKTAINGGTVVIAADSALGTAPAAAVADQLSINGGTLRVSAGGQTLAATRGITIGSSGATFDTDALADTAGNTTTVNGKITGTGALTFKSNGDQSASGGGSGTLGIDLQNAANDFTGTITVTSGFLAYSSNGALGNAANKIVLNGGGLIDPNRNVTMTHEVEVTGAGNTIRTFGSTTANFDGKFGGSGTVNRTDGGTLNLRGDLSGFSGTFVNQAGTTNLTGTSPSLGGTWRVTAGTIGVTTTTVPTIGANFEVVAGDLIFNSSANITLSGTVSSPSATAQASFYKRGTGTLTLTGDNSGFVGNGANNARWMIEGGVLSVSNIADSGTGSQLGNWTSGNLNHVAVNGGTLRYTGAASATTGRNLWLTSGNGTIEVTDAGANLTFNGTGGTISQRLVKTGAGALTVAGPITTATGAVTVSAGTLNLTGTSSHTGTTLVNGGTLLLDGAAGAISGATVTSVAAGGTLKIDNSTNNLGDRFGTGTITLAGGTLNYFHDGDAGVNYSETFGTLAVAGVGGTVSTSQAAAGQTSTVTFGSLSYTGGSINFTGAGLGATVDPTNEIRFTADPKVNGIIGIWATVNGTDLATTTGPNNSVVAYSGGYTDIDARGPSTIPDAPVNPLVRIVGDGTTGNVDLGGLTTTTIGSLSMTNANFASTVDTASKTLVTSGVLVTSGAKGLTIGTAVNSGALTAGSAGGTLVLNNQSASELLTVNAVIANNTSASGLSKVGPGTLVLAGTNTFTGAMDISGGKVVTSAAANLGATSTVLNMSNAAILQATETYTLGRRINVGAGGATVNVDAAKTLTHTNGFTGGNTLTKTGTGALTFSGYGGGGFSGDLVINGGSVTFGTGVFGANLGVSSITVNNTGTLISGLNVAHAIGGGSNNAPGVITINAGGEFKVGREQYVRVINLNGGTISVLSGSANPELRSESDFQLNVTDNSIYSANLSGVNQDLRINVSAGKTLTMSGQMTNGKPLVKSGTGTMVVTSDTNSYSGSTTISAGTLQVGNGGTTGILTPGSAITNNGSLVFNRSNAVTQGSHFSGASITGTGSLTQAGSGTLTLNATSAYTGATAVNAGTLVMGDAAADAFATSAVTVASAGTLAGTGTIAGAVTVAGTLAPGIAGTGTLTVNANVTLQSGANYAVDVTGSTAADKVVTTGTFVATGATVTLTPTGHTFAAGDSYDIVDAATITGTPAISPATPGAGLQWNTSAFATTGVITVESAAGYDTWASGYGLTGGDALRTADPDGDGFSNLQEFLFGTNPTTSTGSLTTTTQAGGILTIRWNQRTSGASYSLKESATLSNDWTAWTGTPATDGPVSGDYQPMKADVTIGAGKDFFRVEGVEN